MYSLQATFTKRHEVLIYIASFFIPLLASIICVFLAKHYGHVHNEISVISATYILYPERAIFALAVTCFYAILSIYYTPISPYFLEVTQNTQDKKAIEDLGLDYQWTICLQVLFLVAWMPDVVFFGIHSILAVGLFVLLLQLQYLLISASKILYPKCWLTFFRQFIFFLSILCLCAIPTMVPASFFKDFLGSQGYARFNFLTNDPRTFWAAIFEWAYVLLCMLQMSLLSYEIHDKTKSKEHKKR